MLQWFSSLLQNLHIPVDKKVKPFFQLNETIEKNEKLIITPELIVKFRVQKKTF